MNTATKIRHHDTATATATTAAPLCYDRALLAVSLRAAVGDLETAYLRALRRDYRPRPYNDTADTYKRAHGHGNGQKRPIVAAPPFSRVHDTAATAATMYGHEDTPSRRGMTLRGGGQLPGRAMSRHNARPNDCGRTTPRSCPNDSESGRTVLHPNDSAKAPERFLTSITMLALAIFYAAMLLPPFLLKWIDKCNSENTDNK